MIPGFIATIGFNYVTRSKKDSGDSFSLKLIITNILIFSIASLTYDQFGYIFYNFTIRSTEKDFLFTLRQLISFLDIDYLFKIYPYALIISASYTFVCFFQERLIVYPYDGNKFIYMLTIPHNIFLRSFRYLHFFNTDPLTYFFLRNTAKKIIIETSTYRYICILGAIGLKNDETFLELDVFSIGANNSKEPDKVFSPPSRHVLSTKEIRVYSDFYE